LSSQGALQHLLEALGKPLPTHDASDSGNRGVADCRHAIGLFRSAILK